MSKRLSESQQHKIAALYRQGLPLDFIQDQFSVSAPTIRRYARNAGVLRSHRDSQRMRHSRQKAIPTKPGPRERIGSFLDGAVLKNARVALGMTQAKVGEAIGLSNPDVIRRWEKGETEPSATMILRLMVLYGCNRPKSLLANNRAAQDS